MKKIFALYLAAFMLFIMLCGCTQSKETDNSSLTEEEINLMNGEVLMTNNPDEILFNTGKMLIVDKKYNNGSNEYYYSAVLDKGVTDCLTAFRNSEGYYSIDCYLHSGYLGLNSYWVIYEDGLTIGLYDGLDYGSIDQGCVKLVGTDYYLPAGFSSYVKEIINTIGTDKTPPLVYPGGYGETYKTPTNYGWECLAESLMEEFNKSRDYEESPLGLSHKYSYFLNDYIRRIKRTVYNENGEFSTDLEMVLEAGGLSFPGNADLGVSYDNLLSALKIKDNGYEMLTGCYKLDNGKNAKCVLTYGPRAGQSEGNNIIKLSVKVDNITYCLIMEFARSTEECFEINMLCNKTDSAVLQPQFEYVDFQDDPARFMQEATELYSILYSSRSRYYYSETKGDIVETITTYWGYDFYYYEFINPYFSNFEELQKALNFYFDEEAVKQIIFDTILKEASNGFLSYCMIDGKLCVNCDYDGSSSSSGVDYIAEAIVDYSSPSEGKLNKKILFVNISENKYHEFNYSLTKCEDEKYRISLEMLPLIDSEKKASEIIKKSK